jgi:hypothetical protein
MVRWTGRGASLRSHQAALQIVEEEMTLGAPLKSIHMGSRTEAAGIADQLTHHAWPQHQAVTHRSIM